MTTNDVFVHDSKLISVSENSDTVQYRFLILWPKDWEKNIFTEAVLIFDNVLNYQVHEGPFSGSPTILSMHEADSVETSGMVRKTLRRETTAGYRTFLYSDFRLEEIAR